MKPYYETPNGKLYCGDCLDIIPNLDQVDLILTDPPYNINYHYNNYKDTLPEEEYYELLKITCRPPSVVIGYMEMLFALSWGLEELPLKVVAWVYNSNTQRQYRGISWFGIQPDFSKDSQPYKNPTDRRIKKRIAEGKSAKLYDWWNINQVKNVSKEKTKHPCQIPLKLTERILKITLSNIVVDPFLGSGTTAIACERLNRRWIGIEISEEYCEISARRIENERKQLKMF